MPMQSYEGTWEEIKQHEHRLAGHRLRVTVLDEQTQHDTLDDVEENNAIPANVEPNYELLALLERTRERQKDLPETSSERTQELLRQARNGGMFGYNAESGKYE